MIIRAFTVQVVPVITIYQFTAEIVSVKFALVVEECELVTDFDGSFPRLNLSLRIALIFSH